MMRLYKSRKRREDVFAFLDVLVTSQESLANNIISNVKRFDDKKLPQEFQNKNKTKQKKQLLSCHAKLLPCHHYMNDVVKRPTTSGSGLGNECK